MNANNRNNWLHVIEKYIPLAVIAASIILIINFFIPVIFLELPVNMMGVSANPSESASYLRLVGGIKVERYDLIPALPYVIVMLVLPIIIFVLCVILIKNNNYKGYNNNNKKIFFALFIISCLFLAAHIALFAISGSYISQLREGSSTGYAISSMLKWGPTFFGVVDFICIGFILFVLVCKIWGIKLGTGTTATGQGYQTRPKPQKDTHEEIPPTIIPPKTKNVTSVTKLPVVLLLDTSAGVSPSAKNTVFSGVKELVDFAVTNDAVNKQLDMEVIEYNDSPHILKNFDDKQLNATSFSGGNISNMGVGVSMAADEMSRKLSAYKAQQTDTYKPWIFMLSSGQSADDIRDAKLKISAMEAQLGLKLFTVGISGGDTTVLKRLSDTGKLCFSLPDIAIPAMFSWMTESMKAICSAGKGDNMKLPPLPSDVTAK